MSLDQLAEALEEGKDHQRSLTVADLLREVEETTAQLKIIKDRAEQLLAKLVRLSEKAKGLLTTST